MNIQALNDKYCKMIMVFAIVIFLGFVIFYYFSMQYKAVIMSYQKLVSDVAHEIENHTGRRLLALNLLADDPDLRDCNPQDMLFRLYTMNYLLKFNASSIYSIDGEKIVGTSGSSLIVLENSESFKRVLSGMDDISNRNDELGLEHACVSYFVPLYFNDRQVRGIMTAEEPITVFRDIVEKSYSSTAGKYIGVVDEKGNSIYHPKLEKFYPENEVFAQQIRALLSQPSGVVIRDSVLDNYIKVYVFSAVNNSRWRVVMVAKVSDICLEMLRKSWLDILIFVLLVVSVLHSFYLFYIINKHREQLQNEKIERMSTVNQITAGIAHEIKNPLTAIKGFIQLMERKQGDSSSENYLKIVSDEIQRIEKLINEFRLLAKPVGNEIYKKVNFVTVIQDVLLLMENQAVTKKITLTSDLPEKLYVNGDQGKLKQVVINLVSNAIEAVSQSGEVRLTLEQNQNKAIFKVTDNGIGMEKSILNKIGTPFFTTKDGGTGLGVSVCYNIVNHYGGHIEVQSEVGIGTEFIVTLPCISE